MAGSSVSGAVDWLLATCATATAAAVAAYNTTNGTSITGEVYEAWPLVDAPVLVVVARQSPESATGFDLTGSYPYLGARRRTEALTIPCLIQAAVGGYRSIRDARTLAVAVFDQVVAAVKADPTLGGLIVGDVALVTDVSYQAVRNDEDATNGRSVMLGFSLTYSHYYIPA